MKISILSDMHIDFHIRQLDPSRLTASYLTPFVPYLDGSPDIEVLIVAGDLGHYSKQALRVLELIAQHFNYKKVFCVLGNHDLYRSSKQSTQKRLTIYKEYTNPIVKILDGDIITYKGVKFGGTMGWYDGTYNAPQGYAYADPVRIWKSTMNDAQYIDGLTDFHDLWIQEKPKIEAILTADVIITHINPLAHHMAFPEEFKNAQSSMFYAFDGADYLEETNASTWVHGHQHDERSYEVYGVNIVRNPLGYPDENTPQKMTIELKG